MMFHTDLCYRKNERPHRVDQPQIPDYEIRWHKPSGKEHRKQDKSQEQLTTDQIRPAERISRRQCHGQVQQRSYPSIDDRVQISVPNLRVFEDQLVSGPGNFLGKQPHRTRIHLRGSLIDALRI